MTINTEQELQEMTEFVLRHVVFDGKNGMNKPHKLVRFENNRGGSFFLVRDGNEHSLPIVEFGEIVFIRDTGKPTHDWDWAWTDPAGVGMVEQINSITAVERLVAISKK